MKIRKEHLERAERAAALAPGGADTLWANLSQQLAEEPVFKAQHLLYYFGGLLMLLPLTIFVSSGFLRLGDAGLLAAALLIGGATFFAAEKLLASGRRLAAGVFSVVSLCVVPLAVYSLLTLCGWDLSTPHSSSYRGFHQYISAPFIIIELCTLAASIFYLYRHRLPFLVLPVSVILWYLGMDLSSRVTGDGYGSTMYAWSMCYGLLLLALAYVVDGRTRHTLSDYSFWLWFFGTLTFWGALSSSYSGSEWGKAGYALVNLGLIVGSVFVRRRVLLVFGALGMVGYLGHLCLSVFKHSTLFPLATLVVGSAIVVIGINWPRIEARIAKALGVCRALPAE